MIDLETELKVLIIESLNLEDVKVEDIDTEAPLFGDGLGLDSIDALELGLSIYQKYQIKFDSESEDSKAHFQSVSALASYIKSQQAE